jgi:hypothetical protein
MMYSITPKRQNKLTDLACIACFVCGIGMFAVSFRSALHPYVVLAARMLGVLLLTAGVYLYAKFVARTFTYKVQPGGIFDAQGRELYDLVRSKIAPTDGGRVFSYCVDLVPEKVILVRDTDGNAVTLTYDERLYGILKQAC